ncbi:hypothetical protein FS837_004615, partial [Tulasnella sp. UAMH 9824]
MNILVNSQRPVGRISQGVIILIVKNDLGPSTREQWGLVEGYNEPASNQDIKRCAALRTVCRAWRDAIDNTPEFTRYILVDGQKTNIEYIRRCNRDGPVDLFLQVTEAQWGGARSSLLEPLGLRVNSLNILGDPSGFYGHFYLDKSIRHASFPMLRVVKLCRLPIEVPDKFALDLLEMVQANQDLTELVLNGIRNTIMKSEYTVPQLRFDRPSLQRVQITDVPAIIRSHFLHCVRLTSSVVLKIDDIRLEDLNGSDSAFGDFIRSLGQTRIFAPSVEITCRHNSTKRVDYRACVVFSYAVNTCALLHDGRSSISEITSERSQLRNADLTAPNAVGMMRVLQDCGVKYVTLGEWPDMMLADLLHCFGAIVTLQLRSRATLHLLHHLGQPLQKDPESAHEYPQFLCPNLTTLDLENAEITSSESKFAVHSKIRLMVQNRQTGRHLPNGPAKLRKILLPFQWHSKKKFSGPLFSGIEICSRPPVKGQAPPIRTSSTAIVLTVTNGTSPPSSVGPPSPAEEGTGTSAARTRQKPVGRRWDPQRDVDLFKTENQN